VALAGPATSPPPTGVDQESTPVPLFWRKVLAVPWAAGRVSEYAAVAEAGEMVTELVVPRSAKLAASVISPADETSTDEFVMIVPVVLK